MGAATFLTANDIPEPGARAQRGRVSHLGHGSRCNRFANDVGFGDRPRNDAFPANFADSDKTSLQVGIEACPGAIGEGANLVDGEVAVFKAILNRDNRVCFLSGHVRYFSLRRCNPAHNGGD